MVTTNGCYIIVCSPDVISCIPNCLSISPLGYLNYTYFKFNLPKTTFLISYFPLYNHRILPHFTCLNASSCFAPTLWRYFWLLQPFSLTTHLFHHVLISTGHILLWATNISYLDCCNSHLIWFLCSYPSLFQSIFNIFAEWAFKNSHQTCNESSSCSK